MITKVSFGWQTTMADLAMILFMVTAAGIHAQNEQAQAHPAPSARGTPLAVYSVYEGAPPLGQWLAEQAPDGRQYLTILARYRAGEAPAAAQKAVALAQEAGAAGVSARIVLEPGSRDEMLATLAFDRPDEGMARSLHQSDANRRRD